MTAKKRNKVLFPLFMIFIIPIILSNIFYFYNKELRLKTNNYGTLLNPPIQVGTSDKKWLIAFIPNDCNDNDADRTLFRLHQLRKALGENQLRVNLTLLHVKACKLAKTSNFHKIIVTDHIKEQLEMRLKDHSLLNKIYLVDPMGYLFMYYPSNVNPMDIYKDISRVLKVSQIG